MKTQYRDLYRQIIAAIAKVEGTPLDREKTFVMQVTEIDPTLPGMKGVQGQPVEPGPENVPVQSGVYLARTFHHRGEKEIAIYNICVMDSAGDIRLMQELRADTRAKDFAKQLQGPLTILVDDHDALNGRARPAAYTLALNANKAAQHIQDLLPQEQSRLVLFGLEVLEDGNRPNDYETFLEEVQAGIEARLTTGLW